MSASLVSRLLVSSCRRLPVARSPTTAGAAFHKCRLLSSDATSSSTTSNSTTSSSSTPTPDATPAPEHPTTTTTATTPAADTAPPLGYPVSCSPACPDRLLCRLEVQVQSMDRAVLNSYAKFIEMTCHHLDLDLKPLQFEVVTKERLTLLKAAFGKKKHRVQYEMRTHTLNCSINHITGSSADTFLEYIQRMCPEGCAMKTTEFQLTNFPSSMQKIMEDAKSKLSISDSCSKQTEE